MKTLSVFVAGAKNLQPLRLRLKAMANDLNNEFKQNGLDMAVNMVSYENFGDEQGIYNKFITEEADMVLFLVEDRIGQKTEEEYRLAVNCYEKNGHPEHCLLLKEFDEKTEDIAHIEELMSATSNKYYVSYRNPDDLMAKVKSRITELAMKKKKGIKPAVSKKKRMVRSLLIALGVVLALFAAARFASGPVKANYVYFDFEFPNSLEQNGINDTYAEQQLLLAVQEEAGAAQKKVNHILNETAVNDKDWTMAFPKKIKGGRYNKLRNNLRKMLNCHDIKADLHLIESGKTFTNDLFVTDWNDKTYHYSSEINPLEAGQFKEGVASALRKDAAYLSFPFNPVVSVLYDYQFINELLEYQMVSPWNNEVYSALDREVILTDYAKSGLPNAPIAQLLLGNYYESYGLEKGYEKASLTKAIDYYTPLLNDAVIGRWIKDKIDLLQSNVDYAAQAEETNMVELLEQKGAFQTGDCQQLVIVGDEETLLIDSKKHYNAMLYAFEKSADGSWESAFPPFVVHLGVNGFVAPEQKREGDLKTPTGYYGLPFAFGKKNDLNTKFEFMEIGPKHVWVSDTTSSEYNKIVVDKDGKYINNKANEKLYRNDILYDYAVVVDYNMAEPVAVGKGSAIFIHIERFENHRTAGCVSMSRDEIIRLIEWLDSSKKPHIYLTKQIAD